MIKDEAGKVGRSHTCKFIRHSTDLDHYPKAIILRTIVVVLKEWLGVPGWLSQLNI